MKTQKRYLTPFPHVRHIRTETKSIGHGHVYQGSYKSFPVETNSYLQQLIRYVEQNPLRAKLVNRSEDWKWSSLYKREQGIPEEQKILSPLPIDLPLNYLRLVNELYKEEDIKKIRISITKGMPFGSKQWTDNIIDAFKLSSTTRGPGRPKRV